MDECRFSLSLTVPKNSCSLARDHSQSNGLGMVRCPPTLHSPTTRDMPILLMRHKHGRRDDSSTMPRRTLATIHHVNQPSSRGSLVTTQSSEFCYSPKSDYCLYVVTESKNDSNEEKRFWMWSIPSPK